MLKHIKLWRWFKGGTWVKLKSGWHQATIAFHSSDGTRFLRVDTATFHETYLGIQALETYK